MKTLWNVIAFFCLVQILTILSLAAFGWHSGRLSRERLVRIREILLEPARGASNIDEARETGQIEPTRTGDAMRTLVALDRVEQEERLAARRLRDEHSQLSSLLDQRFAALERAEAQLAADRVAWEQQVAALRAAQDDEQFARTTRLLGELPAKQSKLQIVELVNAGGTELAVAYLNAMNARTAGRILREFKTPDEVRMAADLLDRLRTFGHEPEMNPDADNATAPNTASTADS